MRKLLIRFLKWLLSLLEQPEIAPPPPPPPTEPAPIIDPRVAALGVQVQRRNGAWRLHALWMTQDGNWDDVPTWAKRWQRDTLGGDHHCYGRCETATGEAVYNTYVLSWPPHDQYSGAAVQPEQDGWANAVMGGQGWDPSKGPGPYHWFCFGGDKIIGLGMPYNRHVSFFAVWRQR